MKALIDFDGARVFAIPARESYRGFTACEGMLIEGPQGWGEFCPPRDGDDLTAARWLTSAIEGGTVGWPDVVRGRVAVAVPVPAVNPQDAGAIVAGSGCRAADVRVTGQPEDASRLEAVRTALGPDGSIRCVVEHAWDVDTAAQLIPVLDRAAGGLEFVQQPCATAAELAAVRRRVDVRLAVDASTLSAGGPALSEVADLAILTVGALGGVRRALRFAERSDLPCVVSAASGSSETSIGLAGGLALAGALPELPFACGLGTATALAGDIVSDGRALIPVEGYLPVAPMAPAPDTARIAEFSLEDAERITWWRQRLSVARQLL
ncbi:enolase C-terminal domain-like protein [Mycolicibacterium helvum]|uniref:O-succinylbenzoate synthase n=1 Tax=Mycolicibacterium helvum TaxID=1534349 RepID=A0A7I7TD16_9MYCO|nr:enolase C-terminal domain-like protein [Mycolicibacterium helvum]BBY66920.1 o-succinylbenzoate synthase [Mycolicibacterium helvum]